MCARYCLTKLEERYIFFLKANFIFVQRISGIQASSQTRGKSDEKPYVFIFLTTDSSKVLNCVREVHHSDGSRQDSMFIALYISILLCEY